MSSKTSTRPPLRRRNSRPGPPRRVVPSRLNRRRETPEHDKPKNDQNDHGGSERCQPANAPELEPSYSVRKAADLALQIDDYQEAGPGLRFRWIRGGESIEIRFVTDNVITLPVHSFVSDGHGGKLNLQCLGDPCCLCLSGDRPEESCLLPVYFLEDGDLGVLRFKNSNFPGTLATQLLPLLGQDEYLDFVVEIQRTANTYRAAVIMVIDPDDPDQQGMDFGDDVLDDLLDGHWPSPEEVVALVERRSNRQLVRDLPWLNDRLRRRKIDPATL